MHVELMKNVLTKVIIKQKGQLKSDVHYITWVSHVDTR